MIPVRPSSFVPSVTFSSSGHTASCRPADPATDSAPTALRAARNGSTTAASVCSLPGPGVFSGPLAALAAAAIIAAPSHSSRASTASTATSVHPPASAHAASASADAAPAAASRTLHAPLAAASSLPAPAAAAPHHPRIVGIRSTRVDAGAQTQFSQRRAHRGKLPPQQAATTRPCSRSAPRRLRHAAAAVAAVIFACSVVSSFAQQVAVSGTSGGWSTAALSQARNGLAATSQQDAGVAIFAGGHSTSCDCLFGVLRDGYGCEGDA